MNPGFLIIIMCYYNEDEIANFIKRELGSQTSRDYRCVIVNNACRHPEILKLLTEDSRINLADPGKNTGYLGGAAFGLNYYRDIYPDENPGFVIVCNTDLHFTVKDFLERLFHQYSEGGFDVLGPDIVSELTGRHQNPYLQNRISSVKLRFFMNITRNSLIYNAFLLLYYLLKKAGNTRIAEKGIYYSLHGSFMVFSRNYFEKGGHFNYGSFLFGEEIFIGELAKTLSLRILYDTDYLIVHKEHATTGVFKSKVNVKYLHESYKYIYDKYYK